MTEYSSDYATTTIGAVKGQSLSVITMVGSVKGQSLTSSFVVGIFKSQSEFLQVQTGYADITWVYDNSIKSAIGTFNYPLYTSSKFKLIATDQVKTPDNIPIINPQEHDYIT
jgi:hypothetical protein